MKTNITKKIWALASGAFVCVLFAILCSTVFVEPIPEPLSAEETAVLRKQYRVCTGVSPWADMGFVSFEKYMTECDTLVYGEVVKGPYHVEETFTLADPKPQVGWDGTSKIKHYIYEVSVIEDSKHILRKGDVIKLRQNVIFQGNSPSFQKGDQLAAAVRHYGKDISKLNYGYGANGTFYVTEDGYIVSAFPEENQKSRSGIHVRELLREFG